jgi:hypothetical protein
MRPTAPFLTLLTALALSGVAQAAGLGPQPVLLGKVDGLKDILIVDGAPVLKAEAGDYQILIVPGGKLALAPVPLPEPDIMPTPSDIIPHARIVQGARDIRAAWFALPTDRYGHGVLGDGIEAAALKVEIASGEILSHKLTGDSVFEDLTPRLADIDGDGRDEIIAVRSYQDGGAAVALFGVRGRQLIRLAETDPIGMPYRWLNPVGAGDFDGDGETEIAVVRTPHIGGILILYRWRDGDLTEVARRFGFSSHAMGSTVLGMSAVLDIDGDGGDEILVPDQGRTDLKAVSYAGGHFRVLWSIPNDASIATSIVTADVDGHGGADILYGLADGSVMLLSR